jgi:hypothetical protein
VSQRVNRRVRPRCTARALSHRPWKRKPSTWRRPDDAGAPWRGAWLSGHDLDAQAPAHAHAVQPSPRRTVKRRGRRILRQAMAGRWAASTERISRECRTPRDASDCATQRQRAALNGSPPVGASADRNPSADPPLSRGPTPQRNARVPREPKFCAKRNDLAVWSAEKHQCLSSNLAMSIAIRSSRTSRYLRLIDWTLSHLAPFQHRWWHWISVLGWGTSSRELISRIVAARVG